MFNCKNLAFSWTFSRHTHPIKVDTHILYFENLQSILAERDVDYHCIGIRLWGEAYDLTSSNNSRRLCRGRKAHRTVIHSDELSNYSRSCCENRTRKQTPKVFLRLIPVWKADTTRNFRANCPGQIPSWLAHRPLVHAEYCRFLATYKLK